MSVLEATIERWVCEKAFQLGADNVKINKAGWPDRLFFASGGKTLFIEFKRPGEEPSTLQQHVRAYLQNLGFTVEVCDDRIDALNKVRTILE